MRKTFRPFLERLEDRLVPAEIAWTGSRPYGGHQGGDGHSFEDNNNWSIGRYPVGSGDIADFPGIVSPNVDGPTPATLGGLIFDEGTGATLTLSQAMTLYSFDMNGGTVKAGAAGSDLIMTGAGAFQWDSGTIGAGVLSMAVDVVGNAALNVGGDGFASPSVNLDCNLNVGVTNGVQPTCTLNLVSCTVITSTSVIHVGTASTVNITNDQTPPVGTTIKPLFSSSQSYIDDQGKVLCDAGFQSLHTTIDNCNMPIQVTNGGLLGIQSYNSLSLKGDSLNSSSLYACTGGTVSLGRACQGAAGDGLGAITCDTVPDLGTDQSVTVAAYGLNNTWANQSGSGMTISGTMILGLKSDGTYEQSSLELTSGGIRFNVQSTFTVYAYDTSSPPIAAIWDFLKVDNGGVYAMSGAILNPFWQGPSNGYFIPNFTCTGFVTCGGIGNTITPWSQVNIAQNPPPGAPNLNFSWSVNLSANKQSLDLVWNGSG